MNSFETRISENPIKKEEKQDCIEELYRFDITYREQIYEKTKLRKKRWFIVLERYKSYKVIGVSFFLAENKNAEGMGKYRRFISGKNSPQSPINPFFTLQLFKACLNLCAVQNKEYSFCFYALDDEPLKDNEKREDLNKRMSVYAKFLQKVASQYHLETRGDLKECIYIGYNSQYCTEDDISAFMVFYKKKVSEEIKELYKEQQSSQKL